eukprot:TRINITY_DN2105_c0_g4_i1.p1 TRINITY_DN2105_c0_g4~~TRINITY_DN2105_c0_g4_i1.p1  ORF type:complete len:253 (+),score=39.45 TRINITY_DN2105_c0_g4_i1:191-949(+)
MEEREFDNTYTFETVIDGTKQGFEDGPVEISKFDNVGAVSAASDGNIYFIDQKSRAIRCLKHGIVSTVVARYGDPHTSYYSIVSNSHQNLLAYSDCGSFRVGILSRERLNILHEAGSGAQGSQDGHSADATFPDVFCVTFMPSTGDLLIAEKHVIRKWNVKARTVSHFAGVRNAIDGGDEDNILGPKSRTDGDGPALEASFNYINDIICDDNGVVYVADAARIRRIVDGRVETVAGGREVMHRDGPAETSPF